MLEKIEAKLVPPERKWLSIIVHEGDAEAVVNEKQEKALAEHVADHPEDAGRTVEDFKWIMMEILRPPPGWGGDVNPWYEQRKVDAKRAAEHDRQIAGLFALEDSTGIDTRLPV
jgi:hypothetical protein